MRTEAGAEVYLNLFTSDTHLLLCGVSKSTFIMEIKEITGRNYYAIKRRKQITDKTDVMDFLIKLDEEIEELKQSFFESNLDEKELADVVLVCFALAQHYKIDLLKAMEEKMMFNEKRID